MKFLLLLISSLLLLATIAVEIEIFRGVTPEALKNRKRILSWWIMLAICVPVFVLGGWFLAAFLLLLIILASREFFGLFKRRFGYGEAAVILLLAGVYLILAMQTQGLQLLFYVVPLVLMLFSSLLLAVAKPAPGLAILITISALVSIAVIARSPSLQQYQNSYLLLLLFFLTASNDIAQYVSGKLFGRSVLLPRVSPNKTLEGAAGGFLVTVLLAFYFLTQDLKLAWLAAILSGAVISLAGILGDLYLSLQKRRAGVKDSGSLIPGHGGLLDRIDSLLLTAPAFGLLLETLI